MPLNVWRANSPAFPIHSVLEPKSICPKELKSGTWTALFTVARRWKPPKCPLREGWINKMCYMHTMEYYYSVLERKENSDTCCNMVKPWGQYGQWNMPVTKKRQILYDSTHMRYLLLLLSRFSRVQLCVTPEMAAHQVPPYLGFSRQEYWSGLPFPSPMHESGKWKVKMKSLSRVRLFATS